MSLEPIQFCTAWIPFTILELLPTSALGRPGRPPWGVQTIRVCLIKLKVMRGPSRGSAVVLLLNLPFPLFGSSRTCSIFTQVRRLLWILISLTSLNHNKHCGGINQRLTRSFLACHFVRFCLIRPANCMRLQNQS